MIGGFFSKKNVVRIRMMSTRKIRLPRMLRVVARIFPIQRKKAVNVAKKFFMVWVL